MTDALSIAQQLIRCPSVTPADAGALGVLENLLKTHGFEVHRVAFSEPGFADVDNLYARIGKDAPHITFAGHTDVVPAGDEAAWKHGAFSGELKDGFLYGRGAVDMKGGIACSVAAVLDYLAAHEMAHLVEMNHSPRFWRVVARVCDHVERAKTWLDTHGNDLHRYGIQD